MVSYSTAKAEALQLEAPRGSMRRTERAVVLILGAGLSPLAAQLNPSWLEWPMVAAIGIVALGGNVSAIRRLAAIARAARERDASRGVTAPEPVTSRAHEEDDALGDDGVVVHQGRTP
jgi:CDP-diacylglycerol--glycerol-3-phosphate 3-phosphatidyltransferase